MRIVITGGHHNSALLVAEEIKKKGWEVFWFGHKFTMIGDRNPGAEYFAVTQKKIPFIEIKAGKWQPRFKFWQNLLRIPFGFGQSIFWLIKIRPKLIVSFGGYLSLPVVFAGWILGIAVVTHEQTTVAGLANKIISRVAKKIFVSFPSSMKFFPEEKVILTGLPIRINVLSKGGKFFSNNKKTIYITGGKQGAHVINEAVFAILPGLAEKFNIIHQCGTTSLFSDYLKAQEIQKKLKKGSNYLVKDYFGEDEIGSVYKSADFVISRAGAHTVSELLYLKKPAILIPIPWSTGNEQEENARLILEAGLGIILSQEDVGKGKLLSAVTEFSEKIGDYKQISNKTLVDFQATQKIVAEIEKLVE